MLSYDQVCQLAVVIAAHLIEIIYRSCSHFTKSNIDFAAKIWYNCIINKEEKEKEIMEEMNSKLSVKYEYQDIRKVKQLDEFSISSNYLDGFSIYQVAGLVLNVIRLTGYPVKSILLQAIEDSDYADDITDELIYLGYGSKEE